MSNRASYRIDLFVVFSLFTLPLMTGVEAQQPDLGQPSLGQPSFTGPIPSSEPVGASGTLSDTEYVGDSSPGVDVLNGTQTIEVDASPAIETIMANDASDGVVMESLPIEAPPIESVAEAVDDVETVEPPLVTFDDWLGYNSSQSQTSWLADDDFGMFSIQSFPTLELDESSALTFGHGFYFLEGPIQPDVRPRLFDFQMAYHSRSKLSGNTMLDFKMGVGAFSDFEGSARKGVRFPGHAVLYRNADPYRALVLGVDVLDRDDISLLPVVGCVWQPNRDLILEMVFPRPMIRMKVNSNQAFYVKGELGGGTWAIERDGGVNDNMTYRDLRILCGLMSFGSKSSGVLELGVAYDRELEYRSGVVSPPLGTAFLLQCHTHF